MRITSYLPPQIPQDNALDTPKPPHLAAPLAALQDAVRNGTYQQQATCYVDLGYALRPGEHIDVNGKQFDERACFLKALELDPTDSDAFDGLGTTLGSGESVEVNGKWFDERACYLKALELDPGNSNAFYNLGTTLGFGEQVMVNGKWFNQRACFLKALELDPTDSHAFYELGFTLGSGEYINVNGEQLDQRACYHRALTYGGLPDDIAQKARQRVAALDAATPLPPYTPLNAEQQIRLHGMLSAFPGQAAIDRLARFRLDLSPAQFDQLTMLLDKAHALGDIADSSRIERLRAGYEPNTPELRDYHTAFQQTMERVYVTAQVCVSGQVKVENLLATAANCSSNDSIGPFAEKLLKKVGLSLPVPVLSTVFSGILCVASHIRKNRQANDMQRIVVAFRDSEHIQDVAYALSKARCETQGEDVLRGDASSSRWFGVFQHAAYGSAADMAQAASAPQDWLGSLCTSFGLRRENLLLNTPMQRQAADDVGRLVAALLDKQNKKELAALKNHEDPDALLHWAQRQLDGAASATTSPTTSLAADDAPAYAAASSSHAQKEDGMSLMDMRRMMEQMRQPMDSLHLQNQRQEQEMQAQKKTIPRLPQFNWIDEDSFDDFKKQLKR